MGRINRYGNGKMNAAQFLESVTSALRDGKWHPASEFRHPHFSFNGLEEFIRVLRAEGFQIEQRGEGPTASYRLPPPRGD